MQKSPAVPQDPRRHAQNPATCTMPMPTALITANPTNDKDPPPYQLPLTPQTTLPALAWCLMPNNETAAPTTKITMSSLFEIRAEHTDQDLQPVAPGWAQPSYVPHTAGVIAEAMTTAYWTGPPMSHIQFAKLPIVIMPSNCCPHDHVIYGRTIGELDPHLHGIILQSAHHVWDTIKHATPPDLIHLHDFIRTWAATPLTPLNIPPIVYLILKGIGRNSEKYQGHFPYNTVNADRAQGAPSYDHKHPDWTLASTCFLCFTILNRTALTAQSKIPAFHLSFDHFVPQTLADAALKHRFSTWFEVHTLTMKQIDPKGKNRGWYSPSLSTNNNYEARTKNSISNLHTKTSILPHIIPAEIQVRREPAYVSAPALGSHWSPRPHTPGTLPSLPFQPIAETSAAKHRKHYHGLADRKLATPLVHKPP